MATIAACPHCYTQLGLPEAALETDVARCPQCSGEFRLAEVRPLPLLQAEIITPSADAPNDVELPPTTAEVEPAETPVEAPVKEIIAESTTEFSVDPVANEPLAEPSFEMPEWKPLGGETEIATPETGELAEPIAADLSVPELTTEPAASFAARAPRRKRSLLRLATGIVGGGVLGCLLGLYGLLWLRGPSADYLGLAQYLPQVMLPPSAQSADEEIDATSNSPPIESSSLADSMHRDGAVSPAIAVTPAQPTPPTAPPQQRFTTEITAIEFGKLLTAAQQAQPLLLVGDFADSDTMRIKGQAYMAMCGLAEKIDAVNKIFLTGETQQAVKLFRQTIAREQPNDELGQIASRWWEFAKRPNQGMFFAGQIRSVRPVGQRQLCQIATGTSEATRTLPVLIQGSHFNPGQRVGIVGLIVANPQQEVDGFEGSEPQIVVATRSFELDAP